MTEATGSVGAPVGVQRRHDRGRSRHRPTWKALPWLAPALTLITAVVLYPAFYMFYTSFRDISQFGLDRGWTGWTNYEKVLALEHLPRVFLNTAVWVAGVVVVTVVLSLALAQFLNKRFPGRRVVRLALIVPWAASVVMTSTIFVYGLDPFYGLFNRMLVDIGLLDAPYGFLKSPLPAFLSASAVAVFVSLPFTTYVILAATQMVPADVLEAAQIDGAGPVRTYWRVVFPLLRQALAVATIINVINVFNSLPILRTMTGSIPGYNADTTTTLTFKIIQSDRQVDTASALSVLNFILVVVVIAAYLRIVRPMRER